MGAFLTGQLLGTHPGLFRAASHTAGGTSMGPNATDPLVASQIVTPYQLHHGDDDTVVLLDFDQVLAATLNTRGTDHELHVYEGYDHVEITDDATMFERVRAWYTTYGVFDP
jgi:predicted esterase